MFQSSPSREAGRCRVCAMSSLSANSRFQSSPSREAGRCGFYGTFDVESIEVSILAQP